LDRGRVCGDGGKLRLRDWQAIAAELGGRRTANGIRAYYRSKMDPQYAKLEGPPAARHERGMLRAMILKAVQKLGGRAILPDILEVCRSDPEIQAEFGSRLNRHMAKMRGNKLATPLWEGTLQKNLSKHLQRTSFMRGGYAVWCLRDSCASCPKVCPCMPSCQEPAAFRLIPTTFFNILLQLPLWWCGQLAVLPPTAYRDCAAVPHCSAVPQCRGTEQRGGDAPQRRGALP
jgi:hypothetical protein